MLGGLLTMSAKELDRLGVIRRVLEGRLPQKQAATMMGMTARQVRRLCQAYEADGPGGLVSRKRGKPSNRRSSEAVRSRALALVRELYADFGPTLACERLAELHDVRVSRETLRTWMKADGLWLTRRDRVPTPHQPRSRRDCLGELVQIDGSDHARFEDRGPACSLLVYVDDATGRLMELRFERTESAFGYFEATKTYLRRYGKPVAFYSDKHSIFRVNREGSLGAHRGISQFGRVLAELNIDIICANTPQAKGRVERMNQTLQDRLVKELRLRGISTMEAGNAFAPEFMESLNGRFARPARSQHDAHRPLLPQDDLERIFCWRELRSMSGNLVVHFDRTTYLITPTDEVKPLVGQRRQVEVHKWVDGRVEIHHEGRALPYTICDNYPYITPGDIIERKRVAEVISTIQAAQRDGHRSELAARRVALRAKSASVPTEPRLRRTPVRPMPAKPTAAPTVAPVAQKKDGLAEQGRHYVMRWVRRQAFLYERTPTDRSHRTGSLEFTEVLLGPVDEKVAQRWQERGNPLDPPPLAGARVPAQARERASPPGPAAGSQVDGLSRLSSALWFADTFHAAEMQRMREYNEKADELAREHPAADVPKDKSGR
jgi:transposase